MQQTDHIVWEADPIAIEIGSIPLPFPVAIWGLVAAVVLFFWGYSRFFPEAGKDSGRDDAVQPEWWKVLGLAIGAFAAGQLVFLVLPSATISQIGPIQPRWYGILFASAFLVGYFVERRLFLNAGRKEEEVEVLLTYVLIATIIGARLGHVIFTTSVTILETRLKYSPYGKAAWPATEPPSAY